MSRLILLRHARAAWADPGARDFERALTAEGQEEASAIGRRMKELDLAPARILCSPARRAVETWRGVAGALGRNASEALLSDTLYSADAAGYLSVIRNGGDAAVLLLVGHNPMIEDLALACATHGDAAARAALAKGYPTAGLTVIDFPASLAQAQPADAAIEAFLVPGEP